MGALNVIGVHDFEKMEMQEIADFCTNLLEPERRDIGLSTSAFVKDTNGNITASVPRGLPAKHNIEEALDSLGNGVMEGIATTLYLIETCRGRLTSTDKPSSIWRLGLRS